MERITSFSVDHRKLTKGVYVSRIDGDLITYDIRMTQPNVEQMAYLSAYAGQIGQVKIMYYETIRYVDGI